MTNTCTLLSVGDVTLTADQTRAYFRVVFGLPLVGRGTRRTLWASIGDDGKLVWERPAFTPEAAKAHVNRAIPGVEILTVETEPYSFTGRTGEEVTVSSATIVRFADESVASAVARYRKGLRLAAQPAVAELQPAETGMAAE